MSQLAQRGSQTWPQLLDVSGVPFQGREESYSLFIPRNSFCSTAYIAVAWVPVPELPTSSVIVHS